MSFTGFLKLPARILAAIFGGSTFIKAHSTAISFAFWSSLIIAGAVALTVFFWPAALAAVVSYPIYGFTIAGLVGTQLSTQIAAVAGLSYLATNIAVYTLAFLGNLCSCLCSCCCGDNPPPRRPYDIEDIDHSPHNTSAKKFRALKTQGPSMTEPDLEEEGEQSYYHSWHKLPQKGKEAPEATNSFSPTLS